VVRVVKVVKVVKAILTAKRLTIFTTLTDSAAKDLIVVDTVSF